MFAKTGVTGYFAAAGVQPKFIVDAGYEPIGAARP
jgi:hypothetical protein